MGKDFMRVKRGMVFWYNPDAYGMTSEFRDARGNMRPTHLQLKYRPYLVVSIDENNRHTPTCNIVPITTEEKNPIPSHAYYVFNGEKQTILIEQITTVDMIALGDYICTLDDNIMRDVERAIVSQFGVRATVSYLDMNLDNVVTHLEELVKKILDEQNVVRQETGGSGISRDDVENAALSIASNLEMLLKKPETASITHEAVKEEEVIEGDEAVNDEDPIYRSAPILSTERWPRALVVGKRMGVSSWNETIEGRLQYVNDYPTMKKSEILGKYGIPTDKQRAVYDNYVSFLKRNNVDVSASELAYINMKRQFVEDFDTMSMDELCDKYECTARAAYIVYRTYKTDLGMSHSSFATDADKRQFLKDYETLSVEDMMDKYDMGSKAAVYSKVYELRKKLNIPVKKKVRKSSTPRSCTKTSDDEKLNCIRDWNADMNVDEMKRKYKFLEKLDTKQIYAMVGNFRSRLKAKGIEVPKGHRGKKS